MPNSIVRHFSWKSDANLNCDKTIVINDNMQLIAILTDKTVICWVKPYERMPVAK
ncbi:TPA: hypothetical protein ACS7XE_001790 [Providencia alcalifaciens]|uniref:hypothetical protein n=1 Tax=Providencia alcalifaciens TaxID=126385 RepID=UPI001FB10733|nr:hypothetical protein [Providencia alcalifaciens]